MDYNKIYNDLCLSRKPRGLRKQAGYEIHHILPRSLGGDDCETNLVKFTRREHIFAHKILTKIYPNSKSMRTALFLMSSRPKRGDFKDYPTIKKYLDYKENLCDNIAPLSNIFHYLVVPERVDYKSLASVGVDVDKYRTPTLKYYTIYLRLLSELYKLGYKGICSYSRGTRGTSFKGMLKILQESEYLEGSNFTAKMSKLTNNTSVRGFSSRYLTKEGVLTNALRKYNTNNPDKLLMILRDGDKYKIVPFGYWADLEVINQLNLFVPFNKDDKDFIKEVKSGLVICHG